MGPENYNTILKLLEIVQKLIAVVNGLRGFFPSKGAAVQSSASDAGKDRPDADRPRGGAALASLGIPNTLDVQACLLALVPIGEAQKGIIPMSCGVGMSSTLVHAGEEFRALLWQSVWPAAASAAAACHGVDALQWEITQGFVAVVGVLEDETAIEQVPDIKTKLDLVTIACDGILEDIKEADGSEDKSFAARIKRNVRKAEDSATELFVWAKTIVSNKHDSTGAMTKQAKFQVVPYIVAVAYATQIRVIACLVERDVTSQERDKEWYLNRACDIMHDTIQVLHRALEGLMPNTSLLEIALDFHLPLAMYLTLMMRFRASVDALRSPNARPRDIAPWDDGLSLIRDALQWRTGSAPARGQGSIIQLDSREESAWWARFTDAHLSASNTNTLRREIYARELSHVLGAGSDECAAKLALKPGKKSALLQLPPASALRAALSAKIAQSCEAALDARSLPSPASFACTNALPPVDTLRTAAAAAAPAHRRWTASALVRHWTAPAFARLQAAAPRTLYGHTNWVYAVAVSADGEHVVSGSWDRTARVWSLSSGQCVRTISGHTDSICCVAVSPGGKIAVSGSSDKSVCVWHLDEGNARFTLRGHFGTVNGVAMSPNGCSIASGSNDKAIRLWDILTGQCEAVLQGHSNFVRSVTFSPDGERLVSGSSDSSIMVWSVSTRALERTLRGHSDTVWGVAVTPDGRSLVSGSADRTVRVWSLSSGEKEMEFTGHTADVRCVAVFPDGQRIASGSGDKSIRVWNLRRGVLELTLTGHANCVESVAVSPNGWSLVSGSTDKTIKVWPLSGGGVAAS